MPLSPEIIVTNVLPQMQSSLSAANVIPEAAQSAPRGIELGPFNRAEPVQDYQPIAPAALEQVTPAPSATPIFSPEV